MPASYAGGESRDIHASLAKLANLLTRSLAPALGPYRITPQQWTVLLAVSESEGDPSLAAVSREMMVSKQNMTGMIARLESLGLIRRVGDPKDLRASMLRLTSRGQQLIDTVSPIYRKWTADVLTVLTENERKALMRAITRLTEHLAREPADAR